MLRTAQMFCQRTRHRKAKKTRKYWFRCLHNLLENTNFESMRKNSTRFKIFIGHKQKPFIVIIKKIKHLHTRSRYGKRIQLDLELVYDSLNETTYTITAIYNLDNQTMVINPIPRELLK